MICTTANLKAYAKLSTELTYYAALSPTGGGKTAYISHALPLLAEAILKDPGVCMPA